MTRNNFEKVFFVIPVKTEGRRPEEDPDLVFSWVAMVLDTCLRGYTSCCMFITYG